MFNVWHFGNNPVRLQTLNIKYKLLVLFSPSVLQTNSLVEYKIVWCRVEIGHEITNALELQILAWLALCCILLYITVVYGLKTVWVEQFVEFTLVCSEILYSEKAVVYTYLSLLAVVGRYQ